MLVADSGSEVTSRIFSALSGSELNVNGGSFDGDFEAFFGSVLNVSGGFFNELGFGSNSQAFCALFR